MNTNLFRKASVDRVNSPEQLNEYIRVANPSVWLVLAAVVMLLLGVVIWGVFGTVTTTIETGVVVDGGTALCYVSAEDASRIAAGMTVCAEQSLGSVTSVSAAPVQIDEGFTDYILYLTGFVKGDFCHVVKVELPGVTDGVYAATITVDSTHSISFVIH